MITSSFFRKIVRLEVLALSFIVLLFHLICMGSVCSGAEVKKEVKKESVGVVYTLSKDNLKELTKQNEILQKLRKLQDEPYESKKSFLEAVGPVIGDLPYQYRELVLKHTRKTKIYKLTKKSINNLKVHNVPDAIIAEIRKLEDVEYPDTDKLQCGVETAIGKLTEDCQVQVLENSEKQKRYVLTKGSMIKVRRKDIPEAVVQQTDKLRDYEYTSRKEFEATVKEKIRVATGHFLLLILKHAEKHKHYVLTEQSLDKMKEENIPDPVLRKVEELQDNEYESRDELRKAMEISEVTEQYVTVIMDNAQAFIVHKLNQKSLDTLRAKNIPEVLMEKLQELKSAWYLKHWYLSEKKLEKRVTEIVTRLTEECKSLIVKNADELTTYTLSGQSVENLKSEDVPSPLLQQLVTLIDLDYTSKKEFDHDVEERIRAVTDQYLQFIVQCAEERITCTLNDQSFKGLRGSDIPACILERLQELKGKEYEGTKAFEENVKEKIQAAAAPDPNVISEAAEKGTAYQLNEESFNKLQGEIVPAEIIEKLNILQDVAYPNKKLFEQALKKIIDPNTNKSLIVEKARKEHRFIDYEDKEIKWSGGSCRCVLDNLSGVVYGFYPFLLAGEDQTLDFSVLSRIGYFALTFDKNGTICEGFPCVKETGKKATKFLNIARKYRSHVDIVVYQNDWKNWTPYTKENLIRNIVNLLTVELTDFFSRIKPYISFGYCPIPTVADGVTLYFEDYPENHKDLFVEFVQELRNKLKEFNKHYYLNIMLQSNEINTGIYNEINKGIYDKETLKQIIPSCGIWEQDYELHNYVDHFLVFIEEPTKDTKKELRKDIEKLFTGMQRRTMLRKTIPIINPLITRTGHNGQQRKEDLKQLEDDLIYLEDNFGGVGFWVLPTNKGSGVDLITCTKAIFHKDIKKDKKAPTRADDVNTYLTKFYQKDEKRPPGALSGWLSGYGNFVTLHRWGFRILFNLLLAIIAVYAFLSAFICRFRVLFMKYFWRFIGVVLLFIGTFFSLLYCDPSWQCLKEGNLILFSFVLVIVVIAILGYVKKSRQGELP